MAFLVRVESLEFSFCGYGSPDLQLSDRHEIVLRKSNFVSHRTLAVGCDAAAIDFPREMINKLQDPRIEGILEIIALEEFALDFTPAVDFE
jgi:uncharacterized protein